MMNGLASATIKIKPIICCKFCYKQDYGETFQIRIERVEYKDLSYEIYALASNEFFDPPVGWVVNGKNNFICDGCK